MSLRKNSSVTYVIGACVITGALLIGYQFGKSSTSALTTSSLETKNTTYNSDKKVVSTQQKHSNIQKSSQNSTLEVSHPKEGGSSLELSIKTAPLNSELTHLQDLIQTTPYDFKAVGKSKKALLTLAKTNANALEELLTSYNDNFDNKKIEQHLFQVLAQVRSPKVEALATELAQSSNRIKSIAGFDLLAELNMPSQKNLNISTSSLREHSSDKELTLAALHALPKIPLSSQENKNIIELLAELSTNDNEAIRSESLLSIGNWAKTEEELDSVVKALSSTTTDDRISAAMALEQSSVVGDNLKTTLLQTLSQENELWEVKSMSANALGRFNLNESEFQALQNFRKVQMGGVKH
jgi:hypothetical protein